jgi:prepilin-type N-terminal cleavage/methylation domain-containing protein
VHSKDIERLRGEEGFTLIEVLAAMVILAVGLLSLEALGIGAARSLAVAETKNEIVSSATTMMEEGQQAIRRQLSDANPVPTGQFCRTDAGSGYYVCMTIHTRNTLGTLAPGNARIVVTAKKSPSSSDVYTITSYVFDPDLP